MRVFWKRLALADLDRIATHIAKDNPQAARDVVALLRETAGVLDAHPRSERIGRLEDTRELVVPSLPYILAYHIDTVADEVEILAVFHGRQKWPEEPFSD